jgi:hypothetical protein
MAGQRGRDTPIPGPSSLESGHLKVMMMVMMMMMVVVMMMMMITLI